MFFWPLWVHCIFYMLVRVMALPTLTHSKYLAQKHAIRDNTSWLCFSDVRWKQKGGRVREGQERQRLMKRDGGGGWALANRDDANDATFGVTTTHQNRKQATKKKKKRSGEDFTSKQFNWRCGMLKWVGGWANPLWSILSLAFAMTPHLCIHYRFQIVVF